MGGPRLSRCVGGPNVLGGPNLGGGASDPCPCHGVIDGNSFVHALQFMTFEIEHCSPKVDKM